MIVWMTIEFLAPAEVAIENGDKTKVQKRALFVIKDAMKLTVRIPDQFDSEEEDSTWGDENTPIIITETDFPMMHRWKSHLLNDDDSARYVTDTSSSRRRNQFDKKAWHFNWLCLRIEYSQSIVYISLLIDVRCRFNLAELVRRKIW